MNIELVTIEGGDALYRRLLRIFIKDDGSISSAAFKNKKKKPDQEPSVDLARLTTPARCLEFGGIPSQLVGELSADVPLCLGFSVEHRPDLVKGNMAHCVILGQHTMESCSRLAEATKVVFNPAAQAEANEPT